MKLSLQIVIITLAMLFVTAHPAQADSVITFEPELVEGRQFPMKLKGQTVKQVKKRSVVNLSEATAATAQENQTVLDNRQIIADAIKQMREVANTAAQERKNPRAAVEKANKQIQAIMADLRRRKLDKGITPPVCKFEK